MPERSLWEGLPSGEYGAEQARAIRRMEEMGAAIHVVAVDVSDLTAMSSLIDRFGRTLPRLAGVIHTAGITSPQSLDRLTVDAVRATLRPKAFGAWVLHRLTQNAELDLFILFSSTTGLWGASELAHYAAANQFLDALAHHRRAMGLPALSVNWGTWAEIGKASSSDQSWLHKMGWKPLAPDQALLALRHLIAAGVTQQAVVSVDWNIVKPLYETKARRPFFEQIRVADSTQGQKPSKRKAELVKRLEAATPSERYEILLTIVQEQVAAVLGYKNAHLLDPKQSLMDMGIDSLMAVELKSRIGTSVGQPFPTTLIFEYPTIEALTSHLSQTMLPAQQAAEVEVRPRKENDLSEVLSRLEYLTDDQAEALLAERLSMKGG